MLKIRKSSTEEELIKKCQRQDPKAQREVYEKWAPKMLGVCMRYIKDDSEAESVMVGGFLKVFEKIEQFKCEGSFEGWIRRIMVNESLIYLRSNKVAFMMVEAEEADKSTTYESASSQLEADDLLQLIQKLPDGYRTVFNLYAIEGYSHKEIGEMLNISENTSKSQLSRARNLLQQYIAKHDKMSQTKAVISHD